MNAESSPVGARSGLHWIAPLIAISGVVLYFWMSWCAFPRMAWNDVRLAPAFMLRHGLTFYAPLGGGPLSTWIYGPMGAIINLPATWARSAIGAIQIAGLINLLTLAGPLAVIFFSAPELRRQGWAACVLAFALGGLLLPYHSTTFQMSDHTATALGLLSCWCLCRDTTPSQSQIALAAALCVGAIWTKQIEVFLVPAEIAFLFSVGARGACARFFIWVAALGSFTLACAIAWFGAGNLWLNLVVIPSRLPLGNAGEKIVFASSELITLFVAPWMLLLLLRWRGLVPTSDTAAGRFLRCATFAALATLPVGCVAFCKIGGAPNSLHAGPYLFPALLLAWLSSRPLPLTRGLAAAVLALALHGTEFRDLPWRPEVRHLELADQFARANPGRLWFPLNPLTTFYTDGRLYHVEDGLVTRFLAGYGVREQDFRRDLPARLTAVVYPIEMRDRFSLQLLPEFNVVTQQGPWTLNQKKVIP